MVELKFRYVDDLLAYYYTESMKRDRVILAVEHFDSMNESLSTSIDLIVITEDNAMAYTLYEGRYKSDLEVYVMAKAVIEQYGTEEFFGFIEKVSEGFISSEMQSLDEKKVEVYESLNGKFEEFLQICG